METEEELETKRQAVREALQFGMTHPREEIPLPVTFPNQAIADAVGEAMVAHDWELFGDLVDEYGVLVPWWRSLGTKYIDPGPADGSHSSN